MTSNGITTGLKFWLLFFLGFALLGYTPELSLVLGLIGGLATGYLNARWHAKNQMGSLEGAETPWESTQRRFREFQTQLRNRTQRRAKSPRPRRSRPSRRSPLPSASDSAAGEAEEN
jgi:hypothetical protein